MAECHISWTNEGEVMIVVALVTLSENRKGVLMIAHRERSIEESLLKGITYILRKVVKSIHQNQSFQWSISSYNATLLLLGNRLTESIERILQSIGSTKRKEVDIEEEQMKSIVSWGKTKLFMERGWQYGKMVGTSIEKVKEFTELQTKKKVNIDLPKIRWALLIDVPESYVAFDLETTGKHPMYARIVEIGAVKVEKGKLSTFHTYVNPQMKLPKSVRELTGITQDQINKASFPWQAIRQFFRFIGNASILIGHNVQYDISVLNAHCIRFNIPVWQKEAFCTKQYAKQRLVGLPNTKLETVCQALHVKNPAPHQALSDADTSRIVFEKLFGQEDHLTIPADIYERIQRM